MTGQDIITQFEALVGDSLDSVLELQLLNNAKNKVEEERDWQFLKALQQQAATLSVILLPIDYRRTIGMYVGSQPYFQIPYEQKSLLQNSSLAWYLDYGSGAYYLLGGSVSGTLNHFYIKTTDDVTLLTSPIWPSRFHSRIAYEMAKLFFAIDQGDRNFDWSDRWARESEMMRLAMVDWDAQLQRRAYENSNTVNPDGDYPLSLM